MNVEPRSANRIDLGSGTTTWLGTSDHGRLDLAIKDRGGAVVQLGETAAIILRDAITAYLDARKAATP